MSRLPRVRMLGLAFLAASLGACAAGYPVPTQAMAKAAMELHRAEQAGAHHSAEGAKLCAQSEQALEQSRKAVAYGKNRESELLAERGYAYARVAIERAPVAPTALTLATHQP